MKIISLNIGAPAVHRYGDRELLTGGCKSPVRSAALCFGGFEGDGQADTVNHGGSDKAVCAYPFDHYPYWEARLGRALAPAAFGENLTLEGALERQVCVGDVYRAGAAYLQVSQPRQPCDKLAAWLDQRLLPAWVTETGYSGFYLRVISEGLVCADDPFELVARHPDRISIAAVNDLFYGRSSDLELLRRLADLPELAESGRRSFARRLESMEDNR